MSEGSSNRRSLLASFMGTFKRSTPRSEAPKPLPEDLGLKTLRHAYSEYAKIEHPVEKERQLYRIIPLFCQNCAKFSVQELETRFPEVLDFAEQISLLFVRHVTQIAHPQNSSSAVAGVSLLKYLEAVDDDEVGSSAGVGLMILKAIHILSNGSDMVVTAMMTSNLCSVLVQCINLFLELPHPAGVLSETRCRSGSSASPVTPTSLRTIEDASPSPVPHSLTTAEDKYRSPSSHHPASVPSPGSAPGHTHSHASEMAERQTLERLLRSILDRLVRHMSAVNDLVQSGHLSLLFGAISRPCPVYNKMWRKAAADCLIAICRYSLSSEVVDFIHRKGCIMFWMRNTQKTIDQPSLDVVESIATIFSCLRDSTEISQVLLDDFSYCRGYKFLYDYLLYLERKTCDETREVLRNVVLLIQSLVMSGFLSLEPTISDVGPFQDPDFQVPTPLDPNHTVKNKDAFIVLQDVFIASKSSHLGITIIDAILNIFRSDTSNYFIVQPLQSLSYFIEKITDKNEDVQAHVFKLFEFVMLEVNYVATAELTSIGLLLTQRDHPQTLTLVLNFLLRLISYSAKYKMIFAQVGILTMMINALKVYANELKEGDDQTDSSSLPAGGVSSPSLPLQDVQGAHEEYVFLLMECLRATIEGSEQNGEVFRENGGTKCVLTLVNYIKPRRLALRLLTQLILLKDGSVDFSALLDLLNQSSQTAVRVKAEVFQTILRIFQLDSVQKGIFRDVCGFHYLISVLASLIGSLAPRRIDPWIGVPRLDILHLVQLIFALLTSAMHDDPANRSYFEINIRFQSFTAPLLLLGCFDNNTPEFKMASSSEEHLLRSGSFTSFESEFKTWHPPSRDLSHDSAVYCASEIFRFLRDMALGIQSHQSTSLIDAITIGLTREKNFYGAPPVTAARQKAGSSSLHLEHPGAVLCMVDLLPAVGIDEAFAEDDVSLENDSNVVENRNQAQADKQDECVSPVLSNDNDRIKLEEKVPDLNLANTYNDSCDNQTYSEKKNQKKHLVDKLDIENKDFEKELEDSECHMTKSEAISWSIFLQERVVSEIYSMALSERNQQALCQIGLPQRIIQKCTAVLSNDGHPLHEALERTFEKLSYQSLTPSDFRSFLRLGNPLCCSLNDITIEDLQSGKYDSLVGGITESTISVAAPEITRQSSTGGVDSSSDQPSSVEPSLGNVAVPVRGADVGSEPTNKNAPFGGSLSLARVQSLVSMTTPRDGNQEGIVRNPPFVEFDLSIDGFACLFLPSVFPQSISQASNTQALQSPAVISGSTSGVGTGSERPFPPNNGLTFSCWLHFTKCSQNEKSLIGLLTLSQTLYRKDKKLHHLPCLRIYLNPSAKQLVATTCQPGPDERRNSMTEEVTVKTDSKEKIDEAVFSCPQLFQEHHWHHIIVVINKGMRGRAKVTLFINGQLQETRKMTYIHPLYVQSSTPLLPYPNENTPYLINAFIGTHVTQRSVSKLTYRLGSVFLFEDPIQSNVVQHIFTLGPSYYGSFQAPLPQDRLSTSLVPGSRSEPLPPLLPEEKIVFGLLVTCPLLKTVHELGKAYNTVDVCTIARELSLTEQDNITPITLLHNSAAHLLGPSRSLGAIMCGYSGIRLFEPQPLRSLISSVGGTSVMLGLVAMATTVDNLYASMKALVCIIGDNRVALKEMERTGGFQVLGMLLHSKAHLINSHILHLTYTLVGTVDSEQSASISNPIAFRDLLANMVIWRDTNEDIQRSLFNHFYDLLSRNSNRVANAKQMLKMKLVTVLLYHLIMEHLSIKTIKLICNLLSTLIALQPDQEDITRIGQLLATTLPSNQATNENTINLYDKESPTNSGEYNSSDTNLMQYGDSEKKFGRFSGSEGMQRRAIVLRNILLDVVLSLLIQDDNVNSSFSRLFNSALGFDWLMLFMDASIHAETVSRAVRILIQLLTDPTLRLKFHDGEIFGGWVQGFDSISTNMSRLLSTSVPNFNPLRPSTNSQLAGASVLTYLLPHHAHLSHLFLLLVANLLGKASTDIPYSSQFNTETLEDLFSIGDTTNMAQQYKIFTDAAYVLLALTRSLLHQKPCDHTSLNCAVDLIKFLTRLYRHVPEFTKFASSQEFIEALSSTLFPPPLPPSKMPKTSSADMLEPEAESEWIMIETQELPGMAGQDQREAILTNPDNLAVCTIIKLLRTIAVNGFSLTTQSKESAPVCLIFERVLSSAPSGISPDLLNQYQTLVLHSIVEYLKSGNEDILVLLRSNVYLSQNMERSMLGLSVFCSRLVDKVWQEVYLKPVSDLYTFFFNLVEQAKKTPKELPLGDLQRCLNRVILYQVSTIPSTEESQKQLMDTLCMFSSQAHGIFDDTNYDNEFLECLTFCLLKIVFPDRVSSKQDRFLGERGSMSSENGNDGVDEATRRMQAAKRPFSGYVPGSIAMMKSGANRLWTKMLEYKRKELEQILSTELPTSKNSNRDPFPLTGSLGPVSNYLRLQNCEHFLSENLIKAWDTYIVGERSTLVIDASQKDIRAKSLTGTLWSGGRINRKRKGVSISSEAVVQDYVDTLCPLLVLAAQKYFETMLRNYQRNEDYRLRYAVSEWNKIEYELTRERGLWGPEIPSRLDKWMLDTVEGPSRMRKRLCRNHNFYSHYPYRVKKSNVKSKYQKPSSNDSELLYKRELLVQRPTLLSTTSVITTSKELPRVMSVSVMEKEPPAGATSSPSPSPAHTSLAASGKMNLFTHPDSDDPIAQSIYRMIEPEDKVTWQFQCATLNGLDSRDGVLLLGNSHFYVIEGLTINKYAEIVDIETASEDSYLPVVPSHLTAVPEVDNTTKRQISIQCIKWSYDTIREIHKRRYLLRRCAIEVFSSDGRNHFLIFHAQKRNNIYQRLLSLSKSSLADSQFVAGIHPEADPEQSAGILSVLTGEKSLPEKWANGEITNFQYLMHLNTLAGRSYNDLMQYPIFPWVLANYSSEALDLTDPTTFRDFSKPMGAQNTARLKRFMERYKYFEDPTGENTPPYYYGTHYSSAMIVASYLIRMEPFTQHFLKLQGGHFDLPDRLFHSIPDAWRSASETNMADIKELIPEFFYLPEFLSNSNHFDLGVKQSGVPLNDIVLPPWAKGDPHEFIRKHREALECDYVSAHLHEWIDLIFGYKQVGEEALKAHNVFHHLFYEGAVDIDKIEDPVKRNATISFIHNFGQMPKQLFKRPHKQRKVFSSTPAVVSESSSTPSISIVDSMRVFYKNLIQLMPSREPIKEIRGEVSQMVSVTDKVPIAVEKNRLLLPPNYNRYFMWGFPDYSARIATVEGDRVTSVFEGLHEGRILCAAAADDNVLLTGGESTVVCVWKIRYSGPKDRSKAQLQLKHTLYGHTGPVTCLAASTSYNLILSGSKDKTCILWDINRFTFVQQLSNHSGPVTIVTVNQLNGNIVTCTRNQIRLWTVNGTLLAETDLFYSNNFRLLSCTVSELFDWDNENVIVTGSSDGIVRLWVLDYIEEEDLKWKSSSRKSTTMSDSDFDPALHGDRHLPVIQNLKRSVTPPQLHEIKEGPVSNPVKQMTGDTSTPPIISTLDTIVQDFATATDRVQKVSNNGEAHESLHTMKASSLSNLQSDKRDSVTLGVNSDTAQILSTSAPSSNRGPELMDLSSTGIEQETMTGQSSTRQAQTQSTSSAVSDNVFSDVEDTKAKEEEEDVFRSEKESETASNKVENMNPTYEQLMAEQRRKLEEFKLKAGKWVRKLTMVHQLTMHTSFHRKDNDTPASVTSLCISKDHRKLFVGDAKGRVFSWTVSDNLGGMMEHWLRDEAFNNCMKCNVEFTFTERKHHCRDCGKIYCAKCSAFESEVERLRINKKVRICGDCFEKLTNSRTKKIY